MIAEGGGPRESEAAEEGATSPRGVGCVRLAGEWWTRAGWGRADRSPGWGGGGGLRWRTPPLAGGVSAREEPPLPPPPPQLGVDLSPSFPSSGLAWQPPGRPALRPSRGGPVLRLGPAAEPVGSRRAASQPEVRTARAGACRASGARGPQAWRRGRTVLGRDGKGTWEKVLVGVGDGIGDFAARNQPPSPFRAQDQSSALSPSPRQLGSAAFPAPALSAP